VAAHGGLYVTLFRVLAILGARRHANVLRQNWWQPVLRSKRLGHRMATQLSARTIWDHKTGQPIGRIEQVYQLLDVGQKSLGKTKSLATSGITWKQDGGKRITGGGARRHADILRQNWWQLVLRSKRLGHRMATQLSARSQEACERFAAKLVAARAEEQKTGSQNGYAAFCQEPGGMRTFRGKTGGSSC